MFRSRPDHPTLQWRKSRRSAQGSNSCVEVADAGGGIIAVRDSKNPNGPRFGFSRRAFTDLADRIRAGKLDP